MSQPTTPNPKNLVRTLPPKVIAKSLSSPPDDSVTSSAQAATLDVGRRRVTTSGSQNQGRPAMHRTLTRAQSIRDNFSHTAASFFGVPSPSIRLANNVTLPTEEEVIRDNKWARRRMRHCSRRYGQVKDIPDVQRAAHVSPTAYDEVDLTNQVLAQVVTPSRETSRTSQGGMPIPMSAHSMGPLPSFEGSSTSIPRSTSTRHDGTANPASQLHIKARRDSAARIMFDQMSNLVTRGTLKAPKRLYGSSSRKSRQDRSSSFTPGSILTTIGNEDDDASMIDSMARTPGTAPILLDAHGYNMYGGGERMLSSSAGARYVSAVVRDGAETIPLGVITEEAASRKNSEAIGYGDDVNVSMMRRMRLDRGYDTVGYDDDEVYSPSPVVDVRASDERLYPTSTFKRHYVPSSPSAQASPAITRRAPTDEASDEHINFVDGDLISENEREPPATPGDRASKDAGRSDDEMSHRVDVPSRGRASTVAGTPLMDDVFFDASPLDAPPVPPHHHHYHHGKAAPIDLGTQHVVIGVAQHHHHHHMPPPTRLREHHLMRADGFDQPSPSNSPQLPVRVLPELKVDTDVKAPQPPPHLPTEGELPTPTPSDTSTVPTATAPEGEDHPDMPPSYQKGFRWPLDKPLHTHRQKLTISTKMRQPSVGRAASPDGGQGGYAVLDANQPRGNLRAVHKFAPKPLPSMVPSRPNVRRASQPPRRGQPESLEMAAHPKTPTSTVRWGNQLWSAAFIDRQGRTRAQGDGVFSRFVDRRVKRMVKPAQPRRQDDDDEDYRPYFTWWLTIVQILITVVVLVRAGFAPWGVGRYERSGQVMHRSQTFNEIAFSQQRNLWLGPSDQALIYRGAKFTPCMRQDATITATIDEDRRKENNTGCCIYRDQSGCFQASKEECPSLLAAYVKWPTQGRHSSQGRSAGAVCGQDPRACDGGDPFSWPDDLTKWPICTNPVEDSTQETMTCELKGRPCCIGSRGYCAITTSLFCEFVQGKFHSEAALCSQVSCLEESCGMLPFFRRDGPDQFYRLVTALFLHAGIIQLIITVAVQCYFMSDFEKMIGWHRVALIYFVTGIGGNLASAIFVPFMTQSGPVASHFGLLAALVVDAVYSWTSIGEPINAMLQLLAATGIMFIIGTLPWVDNWASLFGFIIGVPLSLAMLPYIQLDFHNRGKRLILVLVSLVAVVGIFCMLFIFFYVVPINDCAFCKWFNCIQWPFLDNDFCANQGLELTKHNRDY